MVDMSHLQIFQRKNNLFQYSYLKGGATVAQSV